MESLTYGDHVVRSAGLRTDSPYIEPLSTHRSKLVLFTLFFSNVDQQSQVISLDRREAFASERSLAKTLDKHSSETGVLRVVGNTIHQHSKQVIGRLVQLVTFTDGYEVNHVPWELLMVSTRDTGG
jgi:hypothetical protein